MISAYSSLKAAWHLDKISELREGKQVVPSQVQLIISDLCNQNCHFCSYRSELGFSSEEFGEDTGKGFTMNPNRKIPTDKVIEILDDCANLGVKAIQFTGGGEPTVHPDHLKIFSHAQGLGLKTGLVTNGVLLKPHPVYEKMDWIRVSLDAGTPESYKNIRENDSFTKVVNKLDWIAKLPGVIGIGFVVTKENYKEITQCCQIAKDKGIAYVRLSAMFSSDGFSHYDEIHGLIMEEINKSMRLKTDSFDVINLYTNRIEDLQIGKPDYEFCGYQQFNVYIGGNQKVYRCCTTAYTHHGEIGDLTNQSFEEWFYSGYKKGKIDNFLASSCHHCQFNDKNKVINYLLSEPLHVDFV